MRRFSPHAATRTSSSLRSGGTQMSSEITRHYTHNNNQFNSIYIYKLNKRLDSHKSRDHKEIAEVPQPPLRRGLREGPHQDVGAANDNYNNNVDNNVNDNDTNDNDNDNDNNNKKKTKKKQWSY